MFVFLVISAQVVFGQNSFITRATITTFDPELYNEKVSASSIEMEPGSNQLKIGDSKWTIVYQKMNKNGDSKVNVTFECMEGNINNASVGVDFQINEWSKENYLLMPAAVYNGNRYPAITTGYMPFWFEKDHLGVVDKPILLSNQPRLNFEDGTSKIQLRSGSMSIPSVGYQDPDNETGFWVFFGQGNELGDYGVSFVENKSRNKAVLSLSSPVVRQKTQYFISNNDSPSKDIPANFKKGDRVTFSYSIAQFQAKRVQDLYNKWVTYRSTYRPVEEVQNSLPLSEAFRIVEEKFNRQNWKEKGYYAVGTTDNFFQDWQTGWTGGMITTLPLLINGSELTKQRVIRNFDWFFKNTIAPTGYYYDVVYQGIPRGAFPNKPLGDSLLLTRKNADATYYIYKQLMAMKKLGISVKKEWEDGNKRALEAQIGTWNKYGQLGQFVNQETGRLVIGNTTSAGLFPASLCIAFAYTGNNEYLDYAKQIGEFYYQNFIQKGLTCGGPGDAMQSFDSESSYALLVSMVDLYETTNDHVWLTRAEEIANQFATWVVGYNFKFPEGSLYQRLGIKTNGGVYANTQNQHAAPGICTHSGEALFKLYRFTGNENYLHLIRDIVHNIQQFLSTKYKPIACLDEGWVSERINMTDWLEGIGETMCGSTWAETSLLLSAVELPGVYLQADKAIVTCFDHVEAKIIKQTSGIIEIAITNPTQINAKVNLLIEGKDQVVTKYGYNPNIGWEVIELMAGETKKLKLKR